MYSSCFFTFPAIVCAVLLTMLVPAKSGADIMNEPRVTVSLSGQWEFLPQHDDEQIQSGDSYTWGSILVPALWGNAKNVDPNLKLHELPYCWYRKSFKIDKSLKGLNCLFRVVDVRWQAEVWLNGIQLGKHMNAYRPFEFDATSAIRPGEENVVVIKVGGGQTIPKYEDGIPKIPFGNVGWARGASGIMGDIELLFFRDVAISGVKIDPNIHNSTCNASVWLKNYSKEPQKVTLDLQAYEKKSRVAASEVMSTSAAIAPGETKLVVLNNIQIKNQKLWSPDHPFLYYLDIIVNNKNQVCEHIAETFGMREFAVKNGDFYLNDKRIFLRGATDLAITGFPSFSMSAEIQTDPKWIRKHVVDGPKEMNMNCVRTHMGPWYKPFYEIADEGGMMIIGEFPNWPAEGGAKYYKRPGFTDILYPEMEKMAANLWNHPSIIMWAACNEPFGPFDNYENKVLVPFFKKLDPTRPVIRAGVSSDDIADQHDYDGFWTGTIGDYVSRALHLKKSQPNKPWCDTEYLETAVKKFSDPTWGRAQKWMGYNVTLERAEKTHALFAMEQTEMKRREMFDGLLPFWYSMWVSKGKPLGAERWMTYYALKNSFAPVAVSIGIYDRHFTAGSVLNLPVWAMNDLEIKQKGNINVYIVPDDQDPPYIYAGEPASPLVTQKLTVDIPPFSSTQHDVALQLPNNEGSYWILATLHVKGKETVISKRPIHILDRQAKIAEVKGLKIGVIEQGTAVQDWAKSVGIDTKPVDSLDYQTLIIGKEALSSEAVLAQMQKIQDWVTSGGKLIILDQKTWQADLFGLSIKKAKSDVSYLFKEKGQEADPAWQDIADAYMENWNGSGAEGLTHCFDKLGNGKNLAIGSGGQEGLNSPALVRLSVGNGEVMACQIRIADRLTEGTPMFDAVAERLLVNLITSSNKQ